MPFCRYGVYFCFFVISTALLFCAEGGKADTTDDKTRAPYFFVQSDNPDLDQLPLKASHAHVAIIH